MVEKIDETEVFHNDDHFERVDAGRPVSLHGALPHPRAGSQRRRDFFRGDAG